MIDGFQIVEEIAKGQKERENINRNGEYIENGIDLDPKFLKLPILISRINQNIDIEKRNNDVLSQSLEEILDFCEDNDFPLETFTYFNLHFLIWQLLQTKLEDNILSYLLELISYHYCYNSIAITVLLDHTQIIQFLVDIYANRNTNNYMHYILDGISGVIRYSPKFKNIFFSQGLDLYISTIFNEDKDHKISYEIVVLIKSVILPPVSDLYYSKILSFLQIFTTLLQYRDYDIIKTIFTSLRHLIQLYPQSKQTIVQQNFQIIAQHFILDTNTKFKTIKSILYFLRFLCDGNSELTQSIVTLDLLNAIYRILSENDDIPDQLNYLLIDIRNILMNNGNLIPLFVQSNLFQYTLESARQSSFFVSIQCCTTLCQMILTGNNQLIDILIENNFIECYSQILDCDEVNILSVGLMSLQYLLDYISKISQPLYENICSQEWLHELVTDVLLLENDAYEIASAININHFVRKLNE
ncbi:hypothetical protein TRFO_01312 [Tritrichomonas foetus]|uniref:DUF2013 domain-containing protein n=1 Tax=Tritrichomonas foetus TaxID=1144522 RepID=A0A1J4K878_9EUKA|nr:hypothetical protein TRFO_01312 [Tritrichomonas foetus]|eukprot:OHT07178.1 hypothetical protein TRFO_01312 [Tritrichomonas foetus]